MGVAPNFECQREFKLAVFNTGAGSALRYVKLSQSTHSSNSCSIDASLARRISGVDT
jgi:hypothetical protein